MDTKRKHNAQKIANVGIGEVINRITELVSIKNAPKCTQEESPPHMNKAYKPDYESEYAEYSQATRKHRLATPAAISTTEAEKIASSFPARKELAISSQDGQHKFDITGLTGSQCQYNLPDYKSIDITKPENDLRFFTDALKASAYRRLDLSYVPASLHCMALLAIKNNVKGVGALTKLNLITLLIAPSASGKDLAYNFLSAFAELIDMDAHVLGKPRSDKDLVLNAIYKKATVLYRIDECHGLFNAIESSKAEVYTQSIGSELLSMATTSNHPVSGIHQRELMKEFVSRKDKLEAKRDKLKDKPNKGKQEQAETEQKLADIELEISNLNWMQEAIEEGIKNPVTNIYAQSTPSNIDRLVCATHIESGLIGRSLVFRAPEVVEMLNKDSKELNLKPIEQLISNSKRYIQVIATDEAQEALDRVRDFFDQLEYRELNVLTPLYLRLHERVSVIASLCAAACGVITLYDVRYALACVMHSLEDCKYLMSQKDIDSTNDAYNAMKERILKLVRDAGKTGILQGALKQNTLRNKVLKELQNSSKGIAFNHCLTKLLQENKLVQKAKKIYIA